MLSATVTDLPGATSGPDTRTINVSKVNDAPQLSNAGTLNYTENDPATQITSTLTVADIDDTNLESGQAAITLGQESDDDLSWVDNDAGDGITLGTDNDSTDVLTLTGTGTETEYEDALRAIKYENTGNNPTGPKQVTFKANDGDVDSNDAVADINITGQNDAPVIDLTNAPLSYSEDSGAVVFDSAVTITDAENHQITSATIDADATWVPAQDELSFPDTNTGDGITQGSYDDSTGVLILTGAASTAAYEAAIEDIRYENTSNNPDTTARSIAVTVTDIQGATSTGDSRGITIAASNDAPALANQGTLNYAEGDPLTQVTSTITATDADDTNLESAAIAITTGHQGPTDDLEWTDNNLGDAIVLGTDDNTNDTLTLTGTGTLAEYEAALRAVRYQNTGNDPTDPKTIAFTVNDGDVSSAAANVSVNITTSNDAPIVTAGGTLSYTEDDPATAVHSGLTVDDPENDNLSGGSASITANYPPARTTWTGPTTTSATTSRWTTSTRAIRRSF